MTHGGDIFRISEARGWNWREVADFSASINPLGPAPGVRSAICKALDRIEHYPERDSPRLRNALARAWKVQPNQILLGNGATELIFFLARVCGEREISLAAPCFSEFHRAFPSARLCSSAHPETWPNRGALVLTTPANPTGSIVDLSVLNRRLKQSTKPVIVDESFLEFSGLPSAATMLAEFPQLIILRSLTKFYGLPGLRLGALVASEASIEEWNKRREPWQVNVLAEEAALAALSDEEHSRATVAFVRKERDWLFQNIEALPGTEPHASSTNFIYVTGEWHARDLADHLLRSKILIRDCSGWPGFTKEAVRVAVRTRPENERLMTAWRSFSCA